MRRAAISVISNIAEGASRISPIERNRFFEIARSSIKEIDTQAEIAVQLQYVSFTNIEILNEKKKKEINKIKKEKYGIIKKTRKLVVETINSDYKFNELISIISTEPRTISVKNKS